MSSSLHTVCNHANCFFLNLYRKKLQQICRLIRRGYLYWRVPLTIYMFLCKVLQNKDKVSPLYTKVCSHDLKDKLEERSV